MTKILCLHGFGQSGIILQQWTKQVVVAVNEVTPASFVFPTGNIALTHDNSTDFSTIPKKLRTSSAFAWNHSYLDWKRQFTSLPQAIDYLKTILESSGPYDGLIAFSQGAAYGVALTSLLEDPSLAAECDLPVIDHPPFKFAVLFSGCKVSTFRFAPLYRDIRTPILLYYWIGDKIIPNRWSMALAANCSNIIVQTHAEGHRVPMDPSMPKLVAGFIGGIVAAHQDLALVTPLTVQAADDAGDDAGPASPRLSRPVPCPSDWMSLIEETPFALPRL